MRPVPAIGSPDAERCASEKRACANARQGLQPGVPSCTGPGQPNEICVFPASWPLAVIVGLATLTAGPMQAIAPIPTVTSLRKSWPLTRPAQANAVSFNSDVRQFESLRSPGATGPVSPRQGLPLLIDVQTARFGPIGMEMEQRRRNRWQTFGSPKGRKMVRTSFLTRTELSSLRQRTSSGDSSNVVAEAAPGT